MKIYQVDAFTDKLFAGNPAGVCILEEEKDDEWLQKLAREMNLSETGFLLKEDDGYNLRWFTPTDEVDLCGHGTLSSAHILWEDGYLSEDEEAHFHTRSGLLTATYNDGWIELNFPAELAEETNTPDKLIEALEVDPIYVGKNRFDYIIEVESEETIRELEPDFKLLTEVDSRGVIVTARSESDDYDFISRFFAPNIGINEDPVTGSTHCCLGPYWQDKLGKSELLGYQASKRGGAVKVRVVKERVYLAGRVVTVFSGQLSD